MITGADLGPGETGELCIRNETTTIGYLNKPDVTKQTIEPDGWIHSGKYCRVPPTQGL